VPCRCALRAAARIERLREEGPVALNMVLRVESDLMQREGRFDEALELHRRAKEVLDDLGLSAMKLASKQFPAEIMFRQGRLAESVARMQEAVDELGELGHTSYRSTAMVRLALFLYAAGDLDEAERYAIEGEELGAAEDLVNFALGRSVRAQIAADRGALVEAASLARSALEFAYETDFPFVHTAAHKAQAHVLAATGRPGEARAELLQAVERCESIGDVFEAGKIRALLVEL